MMILLIQGRTISIPTLLLQLNAMPVEGLATVLDLFDLENIITVYLMQMTLFLYYLAV